MFHQHKWIEVARTYAPPTLKQLDLKGANITKLLELSMFGMTTILWRCLLCQKFRSDELLGREGGD